MYYLLIMEVTPQYMWRLEANFVGLVLLSTFSWTLGVKFRQLGLCRKMSLFSEPSQWPTVKNFIRGKLSVIWV